MNLSPKDFGLPPRTVLEKIDKNRIAIIIDRKSRIIMADGRKILDKVKIIQKAQPGTSVVLKTTAPVCSKTTRFLKDEGVGLIRL